MKFRLGLVIFLLDVGQLVEAACKKDQCYKQVAVGGPGAAVRSKDCRSFLGYVVKVSTSRTSSQISIVFSTKSGRRNVVLSSLHLRSIGEAC